MTCECTDCAFRGMELCEHRKLMDKINKLKATIKEAQDRMRFYFPTKTDGTFVDGQIQNVYDVLGRDDETEIDEALQW